MQGFESLQQRVEAELLALQEKDRYRRLISSEYFSDAKTSKIDLTYNDYLGLRTNQEFQQAVADAISGLHVGAGASRLLGGDHPVFAQLETAFAEFKGATSSLYFSSGYAANEAVATVLAGPEVNFFSDQLNHASIIDGIRLSSISQSARRIYPHRDWITLEHYLKNSLAEINVLFTESLFSMDGDRADLSHMMELATKYRGVLVVDEAHAIGCYGEQGRGLTSSLNHKCIISINTCGKALGVQGALVCGPQWFTEYLINKARPFIYSTAPSPWLAAALMVSLKYVARMDQERDRLQALSDQVRGELKRLGFDTGISQSHIIPVICGSDRKALELGAALSEDQVIVKAIRPPTVPEGSSRLRLSLRADLTDAHVETLISAFRRLR